ncbi:MAG: diaminopimelate epimerase [Actinobacteria bacterium]|nr:diaminopimelate epimerase [Actinomycetota bacterium]
MSPVAIPLAKLHATGNDFLVWTRLGADAPPVSAALARALCDRHTGVGADGLILLAPGTDGADATMTLHNADGGIAEMSGNGIRALAWAAVEAGLGTDILVVDTGGGRRTLELDRGSDGRVVAATVDMGPVSFDPATIPVAAASPFDLTAELHGVTYRGDAAGMGNPHWVCFVDDVAAARVTQHGPHLEADPRFPRHTNVEFVAPDGVNGLRMRVWERGVGETLSCGTGACASAAVAHRRDLVGPRVTVRVLGGELTVEVGDTVRLGGPVVHVFDVSVDPTALGLDAS